MSARLIAVLAVLTVITTAAAVVVAIERTQETGVRTVDLPAFPALRERPDDVVRVTIRAEGGTIELERAAPDRWVTPDRAGYPVEPDRVRSLIVRLADMRLIERKTARPERFARIQVEDPDAEDARSRLVRLEDADGEVLAEVILGKRRHRLTGLQDSGTYLRRPGEEQSWLASGSVELATEVQDWLDKTILDMARERVARIEVDPADADPYVVLREAPGAALTLADLGADETLKAEQGVDRLAGSFADLALVDVRPISSLAWPGDEHRVRLVTFEGLDVMVRLAEIDETPYAVFDAVTVAPIEAADAPAVTADEAADQGGTSDGDEAAGDETEAADEGGTPDPAAEAAAIAERTEGWAYELRPYIFNRLTSPREAWLATPDETS